jgi:hypothetical protein
MKTKMTDTNGDDFEAIIGAGSIYFETYVKLVQETTSNWLQLAEAMDAALVIRSKDENYQDEANVIIEGAASSLVKDMQTIFTMLREKIDLSLDDIVLGTKENEYNFVPLKDAPLLKIGK